MSFLLLLRQCRHTSQRVGFAYGAPCRRHLAGLFHQQIHIQAVAEATSLPKLPSPCFMKQPSPAGTHVTAQT